MTFALFVHSLRSDWNHGNAHFVRGVAFDLKARGHEVRVYEPEGSWSLANLVADRGPEAELDYLRHYPGLVSETYTEVPSLEGVDVALVHEWSDPGVVKALGERKGGTRLLFHDTHHRAASAADEMARYDLSRYDGVLAFGDVIRRLYLANGWAKRAFTWHEAADPRVFRPMPEVAKERDLVWVGNWGDGERERELGEFLLNPVRRLGLKARVHGVRYPDHALAALKEAGIEYAGSIANHDAPRAFAEARATVHVPRGPYVKALPGIPTIRVFEALASGIPLVSAPWNDAEDLFTPGEDYLVAEDGPAMERHLERLMDDPGFAADLAARGRATVLARHTCAHRVDELLRIIERL